MAKKGAIIVKKIKKSGGGHHGGAWKVAYADFVTAMMAFFLLMWLLNATTEDQRRGIADYFDPKVPISRASAGGTGMFQGDSVFAQERLARSGLGGSGKKAAAGRDKDEKREVSQDEDAWKSGTKESINSGNGETMSKEQLEQARSEIEKRMLTIAPNIAKHLNFQMTNEGMRIDIMDNQEGAMFESGSASASPKMEKIMAIIGSVLLEINNKVALTGHTDSKPFRARRDYTNWELSSDRALAARRILGNMGIDEKRFARVEGLSSTAPYVKNKPDDVQNRRIGLVILKK